MKYPIGFINGLGLGLLLSPYHLIGIIILVIGIISAIIGVYDDRKERYTANGGKEKEQK